MTDPDSRTQLGSSRYIDNLSRVTRVYRNLSACLSDQISSRFYLRRNGTWTWTLATCGCEGVDG